MRHVSCPVCGGVQGVATSAAIQAQCAFCRAMFVVPAVAAFPQPGPAPSPAPLSFDLRSPATPALATPAANATSNTSPNAPSDDSPDVESPPPFVPRGMLLEFTFFGLFVAIFIGGLIIVVLAAGYWRENTQAKAPRVEEIVVVPHDESQSEPRWSNASRVSLQLDGVKTRIDHVELSEVFARDEQRRVVTTKEQYLTLWVHVENRRTEPADYRSWYGNRFQQKGKVVEATLVDNRGVSYPQKKFSDVQEIKGHVAAARLGKQDATRDTIVFEVPEQVQRGDVSHFHLTLPGAAFGGDGTLRFEIHLSQVEGW